MVQGLLMTILLICVFLFIFLCSVCNILCIVYIYIKIRARLCDVISYDDSENDNE